MFIFEVGYRSPTEDYQEFRRYSLMMIAPKRTTRTVTVTVTGRRHRAQPRSRARLAQSIAMDEGWATVVGAAAGLVGAALGAIGGYVSGRAQARGTVEGVQLQLSGQRAEALWQAEIDACAQFVDACNRALIKFRQLLAVAEFDHDQEEALLHSYGVDSRHQLLRELLEVEDECTLREVALLLRMPTSMADSARAVGNARNEAAGTTRQWHGARLDRADDEPDCHRVAFARVTTYGQLLNQFTSTAQQHFSQPSHALGVADTQPRQRSLFRRRA
ncbi:hypothetical protein ACQEVY_01185 [Streptomyces sp. CA-288835]|uniref:hypothetical protein n=1 Tax=Streptomyces sp. CA-288835 TaxID=3240069 RepID=UPI003D946B65